MTVSMFQASVPPFVRALTNLAAILEKGRAHAQARKVDEAVLLNSRLYPDMFPLVRQVQIATDTARSGAGRFHAWPNTRKLGAVPRVLLTNRLSRNTLPRHWHSGVRRTDYLLGTRRERGRLL